MATKHGLWIAGIACMGLLLAGCGNGDEAGQTDATSSTESTSSEPVSLIFGTGGTSGSYYPIGGALKRVFEDSDQIDQVQVVSTGASVQNINNIQDGTNQLAIVMSDVAYDAINGQGQFEGRKADAAFPGFSDAARQTVLRGIVRLVRARVCDDEVERGARVLARLAHVGEADFRRHPCVRTHASEVGVLE